MKKRGDPDKDNKFYYSWKQFEDDCVVLAVKITSHPLYKPTKNMYGVPRGGVPIAVRLSKMINRPLVMQPDKNSIVVDDIVDSGGVRNMFKDNFFVALHTKPWAIHEANISVRETVAWIVYPWEILDFDRR